MDRFGYHFLQNYPLDTIIRKYFIHPPFTNPGLGDFSVANGVHCDINLAAITNTYYLILICNTACMLSIIRYLIVRCVEKRSIFIVTLDPKSIFPFFFLACMIIVTSISILKIIHKDQQIIGRDFTMTFLGTFLPLFAQWGLVIYFFVVIRCLKSYTVMMTAERSERVAKGFAILSAICLTIPPTSFMYSVLPLVGLPYPFYEGTFAIIYLIGNGINAWLYGTLTTLSLRFLLKELQNQVESFPETSSDIRQVFRRLTYAYYVIASMSFIIGASYIIFGSSRYLMARSTYLFIFQQLTCPPSSTILILTVSRMSHTGNGSRSESQNGSQSVSRSISLMKSPVNYQKVSPTKFSSTNNIQNASIMIPDNDTVHSI